MRFHKDLFWLIGLLVILACAAVPFYKLQNPPPPVAPPPVAKATANAAGDAIFRYYSIQDESGEYWFELFPAPDGKNYPYRARIAYGSQSAERTGHFAHDAVEPLLAQAVRFCRESAVEQRHGHRYGFRLSCMVDGKMKTLDRPLDEHNQAVQDWVQSTMVGWEHSALLRQRMRP